ncbi:MAG: hypothetical protein SCALA702_08170 [Melioribacteraceae bacterium]|nr:MAG: hypothetical protein SCALA702_08170 [Melioribacteraceae bacterium]
MRYLPVYILLLLVFSFCNRETGTEPVDDNLPPSPPTGLYAYYASDGAVGLEWSPNPEPDVRIYYIHRAETNLLFSLYDSTTNLYFIDAPLEYETIYSYKIVAGDQSGKKSNPSQEISVVPRNRYTPYPPRSVEISSRNRAGEKTIEIFWEPGNEYDIAGYNIYRSDVENFTPDSSYLQDFSTDYYYEDTTDLELLKNYYYQITRIDKGGLESDPSNEISDYILDNPVNLFPFDSQRLDYFSHFQFRGCSREAAYKILISENELGTDTQEINFAAPDSPSLIEVPLENISLTPYRRYYWQIVAFTNNKTIPNSYSDKTYFIIEPGLQD